MQIKQNIAGMEITISNEMPFLTNKDVMLKMNEVFGVNLLNKPFTKDEFNSLLKFLTDAKTQLGI